jgi:hypothetical protein
MRDLLRVSYLIDSADLPATELSISARHCVVSAFITSISLPQAENLEASISRPDRRISRAARGQ